MNKEVFASITDIEYFGIIMSVVWFRAAKHAHSLPVNAIAGAPYCYQIKEKYGWEGAFVRSFS